jgi:hypothetical protein
MKVAIFFALLTASAYAEIESIYSVKDLAAIKLACSDPAAAGNQLAPSDIKIFCKEIKTGWEESANGFKSLATSDSVTSSATSSKPNAGAASETKTYPSDPAQFVCNKYAEYKAEANSVSDVTCEQVLEITDLNQFCKDQIAQDLIVNPNIFNLVYTGVVVDTCAVAPVGPSPFGTTPGQDPVQQPIRRGRGQR